MTTTSVSAPTSRYTLRLVERAQQAEIPGGLPSGVRLTLMGDRERAHAAAELAWALDTGNASWDTTYPELCSEEYPECAASERALRAAEDEWKAFTAAVASAQAVTR